MCKYTNKNYYSKLMCNIKYKKNLLSFDFSNRIIE